MPFLIALSLTSLALIAIMITRQAQALANGSARTIQPHLFVIFRNEMRLRWHAFLEWAVFKSKRSSHASALLLAKGTHWSSEKIGRLVARLHRHGRSE